MSMWLWRRPRRCSRVLLRQRLCMLKKPASDIETMDLRLTEYRVEGGDVSSIESVDIIDKGERHEAQRGVDG